MPGPKQAPPANTAPELLLHSTPLYTITYLGILPTSYLPVRLLLILPAVISHGCAMELLLSLKKLFIYTLTKHVFI